MVAISWREGRGGEIRASLKLDREREGYVAEGVSSVFGEEVVKLGKGDAGETGI